MPSPVKLTEIRLYITLSDWFSTIRIFFYEFLMNALKWSYFEYLNLYQDFKNKEFFYFETGKLSRELTAYQCGQDTQNKKSCIKNKKLKKILVYLVCTRYTRYIFIDRAKYKTENYLTWLQNNHVKNNITNFGLAEMYGPTSRK